MKFLGLKEGRVADSTLRMYRYEISKVLRYSPSLRLKDLNPGFFHGYEKYQTQHLGDGHSSVRKSLKVLKVILNTALAMGLIATNPLSAVSRPVKPSRREILSMGELKRLERISSDGVLDPMDHLVLRAFLFSCLTGLRFSDVRALRWDDVAGGRITIRMRKSSNWLRLPVNRRIERVLGPRPTSRAGFVFALQCNFKVNQRLKRILRSHRIRKAITFHCARHTFATLSLNMGLSLSTVQALLGHSSSRTTEHYARMLNPTLVKGMRRWDRTM